jgi:signal transduction histidine kinase
LDAAYDAVLIVDRSGSVRYANAACKTLLERARPEGRHVHDIMAIEPSLLRAVLRGLRKAAMWRGVAKIGIQGNPHELELSVVAVKVDDWGRAHGFSVIARPVLRRSQALARDVFATFARVVGAAAHDFNNQISVVLNYSFILLRELPNNERPERAHMEELQQAAWRAADTARQLLRLGGKRGPEPAALDVNDVIRDAHAALSMFARNQNQVEQRLSQEPCITKARQSELEWLLLDLTQRLRTRLGELKHLRIATSHAAPHIHIHLDGYPFPENGPSSTRLLGRDSEPPETAPRASAQLDYELALEALPDDGLRYAIELPAI